MNLKKIFTSKKKGQAFESFRLLIAFILALAVLVIIYSMIRTTRQNALFLSNQKFKEGIVSATKAVGASTKEPFMIKDLQLSGIITTSTIESYTGIDRKALYLVSGVGFSEQSDENKAYIDGRYKDVDVQVYCDFLSNTPDISDQVENGDLIQTIKTTIDSRDPDSDIYCVIALNKKINLN
jgi:uncharacterized protein (UPF0333 family)